MSDTVAPRRPRLAPGDRKAWSKVIGFAVLWAVAYAANPMVWDWFVHDLLGLEAETHLAGEAAQQHPERTSADVSDELVPNRAKSVHERGRSRLQ